jgi:hypothetical protein
MLAGGYDISGGNLPSPKSIEDDGSVQKIAFVTLKEALQFLEWVRDAYARALDGFTTIGLTESTL